MSGQDAASSSWSVGFVLYFLVAFQQPAKCIRFVFGQKTVFNHLLVVRFKAPECFTARYQA